MTLFDADDVRPAAPEGPLVRVRLTVAYLGTHFHGFAPNRGVRTVGGTLVEALEKVLGHDVTISCAGRTDTGVHAWGQVVTFDARGDGLDLVGLCRSLNGLCGPDIAVRDAEIAPNGFDARHSARSRTYRYTVLNRSWPDPFLAATSWHVDAPLDLASLRLTCDPLIGEHDFSSFCRRPKRRDGDEAEASLVRRVIDARWQEVDDGLLRFEISASAFCHQMVRSIVGTMVAMGAGRRKPGEMEGVLRGQDRRLAGDLAPPQGLVLWAVEY